MRNKKMKKNGKHVNWNIKSVNIEIIRYPMNAIPRTQIFLLDCKIF